MRATDLARVLKAALALVALLAAPAAGFQIEERQFFPSREPARGELKILSTTDRAVFAPLIEGFQAANPEIAVDYTVAGSREVFRAIYQENAPFDVVISSAMDLQMKLANDGLATGFETETTRRLPRWARWRDQLYAFTQEPVVLIVSRPAFAGLPMPETRGDLIALLRTHPDRFAGRIGTYDPVRSGAGYLFATQDARQSDTFWRLAEIMGGLSPRLYAASSAMIDDLRAGRLALAYNVLGSYAEVRLGDDPDVAIIALEDYTLTLLRTALVPRNAPSPALGKAFVNYLLTDEARALLRHKAGLPPIDEDALVTAQHLRPIRLDPGLLVFVDPLKRQGFLREWQAAVVQDPPGRAAVSSP